MSTQTKPSRILVVAGIMLALLIIVAFLASLLTQRITQRFSNKTPIGKESITLAPKPNERAIYLDLPASFPKDMPLPQDVKVTFASDDSTGLKATLVTTTPLEEMGDFYATEFPRSGWTITSQSQAAGLTIIYAKKKKQETIVVIGKGDGGITISVTILKSS